MWDSPEELDAFTATLMPMFAIEGIDMAPPEPPLIHDLVDGGDSRALRETIAELRDKAVFIRPPSRGLREKLHNVTGKPSEHDNRAQAPIERVVTPPEHPLAGHVAIASHVERLLSTHCSLAVGSC